MPHVTISQGTLLGAKCKTENDYEYIEFLQIPYAKPPLGELRFKNPQPPEPWKGVRDATSVDEKRISYQYDFLSNRKKGSEDCLYLNVYTPRLQSDTCKLLPVMIYIHGGGFAMGNGIVKSEVGPDFLIEQDVIIVAINYRVGIFGFLSLNIPDASGNMGLKDQVMALKWVQNNIDKFGGDKNNVTIFGISAGGASIEYHILSPLSKGLFQKAVVQSGSTLNPWAFDENIFELTLKAAKELGFEGNFKDVQSVHTYLMHQPTEALGDAAWKVSNFFTEKTTNFGFVPCVEKEFGNGDEFLTEYPYQLLKQGKINTVIVLRGFCLYEGITLSTMKPHYLQELREKKNYTDFLSYSFSKNELVKYNEKLNAAYQRNQNEIQDENQPAFDFFGDYDFSSGVWIGSKLIAKKGLLVYTYMFAHDGESSFSKSLRNEQNVVKERKGPSHGDDISYIFKLTGTLNEVLTFSEADIIVRKIMIKMWTDFAKTGNPTPSTSDLIPIQWPRFTVDQQQYLRIDNKLTVESKYQPEKMSIFEEFYEKFQK